MGPATPPYPKTPTFNPTDLAEPICQYALQLVTERDDTCHPMGTAVPIGSCLALTARHILSACRRAYGFEEQQSGDRQFDFVMHAFQFSSGREARYWSVARIYWSISSEIAALQVRSNPDWIPPIFPRISFNPPRVGSRIVGFGYAANVDVQLDSLMVDPGAHTAVGEVIDVFPRGRDRALAPFPCFQVNAPFDDSMSGGPVFDDSGHLCGLICSNLPPFEPGEDHASLVALLWPSAGLSIDAPWAARPPGSWYPMLDLFNAIQGGARGLDGIAILPDGKLRFRQES